MKSSCSILALLLCILIAVGSSVSFAYAESAWTRHEFADYAYYIPADWSSEEDSSFTYTSTDSSGEGKYLCFMPQALELSESDYEFALAGFMEGVGGSDSYILDEPFTCSACTDVPSISFAFTLHSDSDSADSYCFAWCDGQNLMILIYFDTLTPFEYARYDFQALLDRFYISGSESVVEEESPSTEILFRGLPWGCSIDEVISNIKAAAGDVGYIRKDWDVHHLDYKISVDESSFCYIANQLPNDFFVAGHLVKEVSAEAIYGIRNGIIMSGTGDSHFFKATYYFMEQVNMLDVYNDLVNKLCGLYGSASALEESSYDHASIWYGANQTAVTIEMNDGDYPRLHITYWDLSIEEAIIEMQQAAYTGDLSSSDGL